MELKGNLRHTTLGDVLGTLYRARATGVLELTETMGIFAGRTHRLVVSHGLVRDVDSRAPATRLGDILRARGHLRPAAARIANRLLLRGASGRCGEMFIAAGLVSRVAVCSALELQRRERLESLFVLSDARIAFRVAQRNAPCGPGLPMSPREFLHGRPRWRDGSAPKGRQPPGRPLTGSEGGEGPRARAFAVLGLENGADQAAVQQAFRRLAARLHPDRFPGADPHTQAARMRRFAEISEAYHCLVA